MDEPDFQLLCLQYVNGRVDATGAGALEAAMLVDPARRERFVATCLLHSRLIEELPAGGVDTGPSGATVDVSLHDAAVLPAIRWADAPVEPDEAVPAVPLRTADLAATGDGPRRRMGPWWYGIAAAVVLGAGVMWSVWPARRAPVLVTALANGTVVNGTASTNPGTALTAGGVVRVDTGELELTFPSGAVAVVRGPAVFRPLDANAIALDAGTLAVHVPPAARGFRVAAAGLSVVDRGCDFGVRSTAGSGAEVDVFAGAVDATPVDPQQRPVAPPVRLTAGEAVAAPPAGAAAGLVRARFAPEQFDRDLDAARQPVPQHGTGDHLAGGAADPYWLVVRVPDNPAWQPRPAVVAAHPPGVFAAATPDRNWVSTTPDMADAPAGTFVFHTTVDLSGFRPASVLAHALAAADDQVIDVRVNGVSTGAATPPDESSMRRLSTLTINGPWAEGVNQVDVVVKNNAEPPPPPGVKPSNAMALQFQWQVTASPVVRRIAQHGP